MGKKKTPKQPLENYLDENKFYNHGDNPALKHFMQIVLENTKNGEFIDKRTYVVDRGQRFLWARNWDDFLQRDMKAITFPRAFGMFVINTMACMTALAWTRRLLPVGKFGIRSVTQTSFYNNFGPIGLAGVTVMAFGGVYTWWKTFKFTLHKFYRHVLMGHRNWILEENKISKHGEYDFHDNPLSNEDRVPKSDFMLYAGTLERQPDTFKHPYQAPQ